MITLLPHQQKVLDETSERKRVAYYLDMGLGKTFVGSEKMNQLGNNLNMVICQKSKVTDWTLHFKKYYKNYFVIDFTKKENQTLSAEDIVMFSGHTPVVIIVNYELAWRRPELSKLSDFTLILDESSLIQNSTAKQSKFIIGKLKFNAIILLSGTPCGGKFENIWTQYHLLGGCLSKVDFEHRFVNFITINNILGFPISIVDKKKPYKRVNELKDTLRVCGAVFMKTEEVINLPEQRFIFIDCPITKNYRKFLKTKVLKINETEFVGDTPLNFRRGLRKLASGYSEEKLRSFQDLIKSTSDRLIVFYNFNQEVDELVKIAEAENRPISYINGKIKDLEAYENEDNSITFCQYQAGSMGHNLQKADKIVYFSLSERSELFEQSKKRIHRIGQKNNCTYYIMQSSGTIDQLIYQALEQKRDFTDELFTEYTRRIK